MKKLIAILILPLAMTACKDKANKNPVKNVQEAAKERDLQRTWQTECQLKPIDAVLTGLFSGLEASVKSMRVQYKFEGANVNRVTSVYATTDCAQEAYTFNEEGSFTLNKSQKTNDGGFSIDMKFSKLKLKIADDNGAKAANAISLCGRNDWSAGKEEGVTTNAKDATCYGIQVPRTNYNIYRIEEKNTLYLGTNPTKATQPSDRPATLNRTLKFSAK